MTAKPLPDRLYATLRAAADRPDGRIDRGRDADPGAVAGLGVLLMLERRRWARLQRDVVTHPRTGQPAREVTGGWLTPYGRTALREEARRRGDDMPAQPARRAAAPGSTPTPRTSVTVQVDPFALVASGTPRTAEIPF